MRLGIALLALAGLLVPVAQAGGPSKEYKDQTHIRCEMVNGCRRLKQIAVGRAQTFCQADGGVLRGELSTDYKCENRGLHCVITGRIECRGRMDPTKPPPLDGIQMPRGSDPEAVTARAPVCMDEACDTFVDYAPGHREQGMHACRGGYAMIGVGGATGDILCRRQPARFVESTIDIDTVRHGLRVCPPNQVMIGLSDDRSRLLCARFSAKVRGEVVQKERLELGLQVCDERDGVAYFLTGIDGARRAISCAAVRP